MRYLDPKNDLTFKKIFVGHPDLLKSFLNALLPLKGNQLIKELIPLPQEQIPVSPGLKNSTVDVKCKDKIGRQFIVEMQMAWNKGFKSRALFNTAKAYVRQIGKGYKYTALKPVYTLCILNDTFHQNPKECYHHYTFINSKDLNDKIENMSITYIELPKFYPRSFSEKKMAVLWLRFLTEIKDREGHIQQIPEVLTKNKYTGKALEILEESSFSEVELEAYDKYWDSVSVEKDGLEGALEKGREKGREEGREKKEIEAILGLHKNGVSITIISEALNITEKRIHEIIKLEK